MRIVLRNSAEVAHYWANQVQSSGRAGNMFFRDGKIYSYGLHFCIARHLPTGEIAFTTRDYSVSTGTHKRHTHRAIGYGRTLLYVNDPADSPMQNLAAARSQIRDLIDRSTRARVRRAALLEHALNLARGANAFLAALPDESVGCVPIAAETIDALQQDSATYAERERAAREVGERLARERAEARRVDLAADLVKWRANEIMLRTGLYDLPPALRLSSDGTRVETSHGADIPVRDARRLWGIVCAARDSGIAVDLSGREHAGVYGVRLVRGDGSMLIGCHDIAYSEVEGIARQLGYLVPA